MRSDYKLYLYFLVLIVSVYGSLKLEEVFNLKPSGASYFLSCILTTDIQKEQFIVDVP
ncbi:MAG TPA: hypothetical protein VK766_08910 [Cytophagaceae bacterium]|jgi:hypothetical protein|nr:hypothetical protein [Cytophagaceae bacterium]